MMGLRDHMAAEETAGRVPTVLEMRQIKDFSPSLATAGKHAYILAA